jgi:hypothetical protein
MRIGTIRFSPALTSALALLASAALAAPHPAASHPSAPHVSSQATLFTAPGFHGHWLRLALGSRELTPGKFVSGRFVGEWTLCDAPDFGGHCVSAHGEVRDFGKLGLTAGVVSLRPGVAAVTALGVEEPSPAPKDAPPADDGYYDLSPATAPPAPAHRAMAARVRAYAAPASQGVVGEGSVFFAHPQRDGADVLGSAWQSADDFCHDQNLGPALYFDADTPALRDVLCRRD